VRQRLRGVCRGGDRDAQGGLRGGGTDGRIRGRSWGGRKGGRKSGSKGHRGAEKEGGRGGWDLLEVGNLTPTRPREFFRKIRKNTQKAKPKERRNEVYGFNLTRLRGQQLEDEFFFLAGKFQTNS